MSILVPTHMSFVPQDPVPALGGAVRAMASSELQQAARQFVALAGDSPLHRVAAGLHRLAAALEDCERAGLDRALLLPWIEEVRALHASSPFVRRLQTWPRGYPGDFETVEWLCDGVNRAEPGTVGWAIEQVALQSPVAQQHRNKVRMQADAVRQTLEARRRARVASLGCGGCRDLRLIVADVLASDATFTLVDADADALAFANGALHMIEDRCVLVQGRVPRVLPRLRDGGPYDLVVAGGLFDYLPPRWAVETLRQVRVLLDPRGTLVFSNIAKGNPYRVWIEYLADWRLIERSEEDLRGLLAEAGFDPGRARVAQDATGLASIVSARP